MRLFNKKKKKQRDRDREGSAQKDDKTLSSHRLSIAASNEDLRRAEKDIRSRTATEVPVRRDRDAGSRQSFLPTQNVPSNVIRSNTSLGKSVPKPVDPKLRPTVPPAAPVVGTEASIGRRLSLGLQDQEVNRHVGPVNGIDETSQARSSLSSQSEVHSDHDELKEALKEVIRVSRGSGFLGIYR